MLQAYFDESAEQGKIFVLGGYISTVEKWKAFSNEWGCLLKKHGIPEFKMNKNGHNYDRAVEFYRVLQKNVIASISCSIDLEFLDWFVPQMGIPPERKDLVTAFNNPYNWAFKIIFADAIKHKHKVGLDGPIDFVFDERSESEKVLKSYKYLIHTAPQWLLDQINSTPTFQSSQTCLPLQAADMYAWCVRKGELNEGWKANSYFKDESPIPELFIRGGSEELSKEILFVFSEENTANHNAYVAAGN